MIRGFLHPFRLLSTSRRRWLGYWGLALALIGLLAAVAVPFVTSAVDRFTGGPTYEDDWVWIKMVKMTLILSPLLLLLSAAGWLMLVAAVRRSPDRIQCRSCGYDLRGTPSGGSGRTCSECGHTVETPHA